MNVTVKTIEDFLKALPEVNNDGSHIFFYRGEQCNKWESSPSLFRESKFLQYEHEMFKDMISKCPDEFNNNDYSFNKLVKMQHYGLPTRLLDITTNPLVALYFSCENECTELNGHGIVKIYKISKDDIKYFDSDSVCIISNLAKMKNINSYIESLNKEEIEIIDDDFLKKRNDDISSSIKRLLHEIRQEKPQFKTEMKIKDFLDIKCVIPKMDNDRIKAQQGAFFLYSASDRVIKPEKEITVDNAFKDNILDSLRRINISQESMYPEIDNIAQSIKTYYAGTKRATEEYADDALNIVSNIDKEIKTPIISSENIESELWWHSPMNSTKGFVFSEEIDVDKKLFIGLLSNSFSLEYDNKKRVIDAIPTLSQFQVDELIKVWQEESNKFKDLLQEAPHDVAKLAHKALLTWAELLDSKEKYWIYIKKITSENSFPNIRLNRYILIRLLSLLAQDNESNKKFDDEEIRTYCEIIFDGREEYYEDILKYLFEQERYKLFTSFYEEYSNKLNNISKFYHTMGHSYIKLKNYKESSKYYLKAIKKDKSQCLLDYVEVCLLDKQIENAKKYLETPNSRVVCSKKNHDYLIIIDLLEIIIHLIEKEDNIKDEIQDVIGNLESKNRLQISWNMEEIEEILKVHRLKGKAKQYKIYKVIEMIKNLMAHNES